MNTIKRVRKNKCLVMILIAALILSEAPSGTLEVCAAGVSKGSDYMDIGACGKNLSYVLDGDGVLNITGEGGMTDFANVSAVPWFQYRSLIKTVVFSGNITSISAHAFEYCVNLSDISIPDSVVSLGANSFYGCTAMKEVKIPNSVEGIGAYAFCGCTGLTAVTLGDHVTSIGASAFAGCTELMGISIPDSVMSIGEKAFDNTGIDISQIPFHRGSCGEDLTWVLMGNHKLYINGTGEMTDFSSGSAPWYSERESLTEVILADGVTGIGAYAFEQFTALSEIDMRGVTKVSDHAFYGSGLTALNISGSDKVSIGDYAFSGCKKLDKVQLPEGITELGSYAFQNCSAIQKMVLPNSLTTLRDGAFDHCSGLTGISLPEGLEAIGGSAFAGCTSLTDIELPKGVTKIEKETFRDCSGLQKITIPERVSAIGDGAFSGCSLIKKMALPQGITSIGENAFKGCSGITDIVVPDSVTSIGGGAFSGCSGLTRMELPFAGSSAEQTAASKASLFGYIFGSTKYTGGTAIRQKYSASATVDYYIPDSLKEVKISGGTVLYGTFYGCAGLTSLTLPENLTEVGAYAFYGCTGLSGLNLSGKLTGVGDYAFYGCSGLTGLTLPENLTKLGNYAFKDCIGLKEISVPGKVISIGNYAFSGCKELGNIVISDGVTSIGNYAFQDCSCITKIAVPDSVTTIGISAFSGCGSLQSMTLPFVGGSSGQTSASSKTVFGYIFGTKSYTGSVAAKQSYSASGSSNCYIPASLKNVVVTGGTNLLYGAFSNCSGLTAITLPKDLTSVGQKAFYDCTGLTEITIPQQVTKIENYAFGGCTGMQHITFSGNAPETIGIRAFQGDTLTAYYPVSDPTWSDYAENPDKHQYSGTLAWQSHTHSYRKGVTTAPTCTEQGYTTYQCADCQSSYTSDFVNATGHVPVVDNAVKETCASEGLTEGSHCSACAAVIVAQTKIPKTGHKFAAYVSNKDATYDADGTKTGTCSVCGEKDTVTEPNSKLVDQKKPSVGILLGANHWTELLDTITFGLFFRDAQTAEIRAVDNETLLDGSTVSRLDGVYYYVSGEEIRSDRLDSVSWSKYTGKIQVDPDRKCIIYAKAVDRSGNTSYASSAGLVVDHAAPAIDGVSEGGVYCEKAVFKVTDLSLKSVTDNGKTIAPSDGSYVIAGDDGRHTITAVDDCGNKADITVTVKKQHTWGEPVFIWGEDHKSCTAEYTCANDRSHTKEIACQVTAGSPDAGCVTAWEVTYTASAVLDGVEKTDTKKVSGLAKGHDYEARFTWADDLSSCRATLTCRRAGCSSDTAGHQLSGMECAVEARTTAATCVTEGKNSVTAVIMVGGVEYTDDGSKEVIPLDPDHHASLQIVGQKEATATEAGYTGDTWCGGCGRMVAYGSVIPATGAAGETPTLEPGNTGEPTATANPTPEPGNTGEPTATVTPVPEPGNTREPISTSMPEPGDTGDSIVTPEPGNAGKLPTADQGNFTPEPDIPATGTIVVSGKLKYKITSAASGSLTAAVQAPVSKKAKSLTIPADIKVNGKSCKVTSIAANAFKNCTKLKKITIGKNITAIGKNAFYKAKTLKNIVVKSSDVKSVGKNAWKGIHKKAVIRVPKKKLAKYKKLFGKKGQKRSVKIVLG